MTSDFEVSSETRRKRSGSEKRKRGSSVGFRASDDELEKITASADRVGLTVSSYVRSRALDKPTTRAVRRPPLATAQLAQLLGLLGSVGGDLQRLAQNLDSASPAVNEINTAIVAFRAAASTIMQTLGKRAHDH